MSCSKQFCCLCIWHHTKNLYTAWLIIFLIKNWKPSDKRRPDDIGRHDYKRDCYLRNCVRYYKPEILENFAFIFISRKNVSITWLGKAAFFSNFETNGGRHKFRIKESIMKKNLLASIIRVYHVICLSFGFWKPLAHFHIVQSSWFRWKKIRLGKALNHSNSFQYFQEALRAHEPFLFFLRSECSVLFENIRFSRILLTTLSLLSVRISKARNTANRNTRRLRPNSMGFKRF